MHWGSTRRSVPRISALRRSYCRDNGSTPHRSQTSLFRAYKNMNGDSMSFYYNHRELLICHVVPCCNSLSRWHRLSVILACHERSADVHVAALVECIHVRPLAARTLRSLLTCYKLIRFKPMALTQIQISHPDLRSSKPENPKVLQPKVSSANS